MSAQSSSMTSSPLAISGGTSWDIPSKDMLGSTANAMTQEAPPHRNNMRPGETAEIDTSGATSSKDESLGPNENFAQTTPATDSGLTCDPTFDFSDTNIQIKTGNRLFRIHQLKLDEFDHLRQRLEQAALDGQGRRTLDLQDNADDVHNLLVVLYSSIYNPNAFSTTVLKSTAKLAAKYDHPSLREFAIAELKKHTLEPIDRFILARDCGVTGWMPKAIDDLCWREEPITVAEAQILGPEKFVEVAARREAVNFDRGSRVGLSSEQPMQEVGPELQPEPTVPSRAVSHGLEVALADLNNGLTTIAEDVQATSDAGPRLPTPARDATPVNPVTLGGPSNNPTKSEPNPSLLGFGRFSSKPLPFRLESQPLGPSPF